MKHTYKLLKTDHVCDIDQVLSVLRQVPGILSAVLLEGEPRVAIDSEEPMSLETINAALAKTVPCRLTDGILEAQ